MRTLILLLPVAAFGCAHQASETSAQTASEPGTETASAAPPSETAEAPPPKTLHEMASAQQAAEPCPAVRVHFAFDSDVIEDTEKPHLDQAARCLQRNDRMRVSVEGNADDRGTEAYNKDLGERRAAAVARYLHEQGVSTAQLQAVLSHGENNPVCEQQDEVCWARNRRTAIRATCHL